MTSIAGRRPPESTPDWPVFTAVCVAYLAVTIGESLLAPLLPLVVDDLDLDLATAGLALGLLSGSIAVGNVLGGYVLARRGPKTAIVTSLATSLTGSIVAATTGSLGQLFGAQVLLGLGTGLFFAPGINVVGTVGGARRGLAMGLFGVAFSGALTVAAALAWLGAEVGWRLPFAVGAIVTLLATGVMTFATVPPRSTGPAGGYRKRLRDALGMAAAVGAAGALVQYGTVAFFPAFAVVEWDVSIGAAALALALGRALSIPAKMVTGSWVDRVGAVAASRRVGILLAASGAWWTLVPGPLPAVVGAVVFAAATSSVFPIANMLAFEAFGDRGPLLGMYRSVQMGVGSVGGITIGAASAAVGLRPVLAATAIAVPTGLILLGSRHPAP